MTVGEVLTVGCGLVGVVGVTCIISSFIVGVGSFVEFLIGDSFDESIVGYIFGSFEKFNDKFSMGLWPSKFPCNLSSNLFDFLCGVWVGIGLI